MATISFPRRTGSVSVALISLLIAGCNPSTTSRVKPPEVDSRTAAAEAIRLYDTNGDGSLDESELAACPAIKSHRERYDKDGNRQVSPDEIVQRLDSIYSTTVGLLEVQCTLTRRGRPLSDATVRFIPAPFLGDAVQTAVATTNSSGVATPSIPADLLPERLRNLQMMQVGLYAVEIEHSSLPGGAVKGLGFEVDPTRRDGTTARFDL